MYLRTSQTWHREVEALKNCVIRKKNETMAFYLRYEQDISENVDVYRY